MLLYALAEKLGRTVAELREVLTPDEMQHWRALWKMRQDNRER